MAKAAKSPWTVMVGVAASIVALVAAFTGPVVVIGAPTSTTPDVLRVVPLPDGGVTQFFLPIDAPLAEMPYGFLCPPESLDWLEEHGVKRPPSYLMSMRSNADDGPMLTIDNVRVVNKKTVPPRPGYLFDCSNQGSGDTAILHLDLDRDGPAMLVDEEDRKTERPFAFNLEPGEEGSIDLRMQAAVNGYSGRVVADVTGGGATAQVELALDENGGDFERPGLGRSAGFFVSPSQSQGVFLCEWLRPDGSYGSTKECDADEVRSIATEMWK